MYFIGNIKYFLTQRKFGKSAIQEIIGNLEKQTVNKTPGNKGLVVAGSIDEFLDKDTAKAFREDFQKNPDQLEIAINKGELPSNC